MVQFIQRYNMTELLDTMYITSSFAEHILHQLIQSFNETEIQYILKNTFSSLFEQNHFLHDAVPLPILLDCEKHLLGIDANLLFNFKSLINQFAILISLLENFNQLHKVQNEHVFQAILQNFHILCFNQIPSSSVLIFILILYHHSLLPNAYQASIYADNIPYGVTVLLSLFNLV